MVIVNREFATHGHLVRLLVEDKATGWEVQEQCDAAPVHVGHYTDWHRVERAMQLLEMEALRHGPADTPHR